MSKLGDDLIRSLKEAAAHAKGEGPGIEHAPARERAPEAGESQAGANDVSDNPD